MSQSGFQNLIQELRRRRVFRVATLYVVSVWPILQIADILSPALNFSDGTMRSLLLYFVMGFPIAIIIAWLYNLTPKGLVRNDGEEAPSRERLFGNRLEMVVIVFFVTLAGLLFTFQEEILDMTAQPPQQIPQTQIQSFEPLSTSYQSIAVLPFVPFSDNRQDEYFADGLAEELLNMLAKIQSIRVAARTSSFAYKGLNRNIQKIGRELGVDVILEGSVRRNDINNTIRVTAQLIEVRTGTHIWSETYDRQFEDIFKIQDEITEAVVGELKIALLGDEREKLIAHDTANPDAIVAHSKGRAEIIKRTETAIIQAKEFFEQAVELDPNYATAYASLAEANALMISYAGADRETQSKLAQTAVDKALSIDKDLGLAWAAQGLVFMGDEEKRDEAKEALKKAIKLNPSYAMAYMWYADFQEDIEDKIRLYEKSFQLDPNSPVAGFNLAIQLMSLGRDAEAMDVFSKMVDADPFYPNAYFLVGQISQANGRIDQAIVNYKKSYDLGETKGSALSIAHLYADLGDTESSRLWMSQLPEETNKYKRGSIDWLNVRLLAEEGRWKVAKEKLAELADVGDSENVKDHMNAIIAHYYLEDFPATIKAFETAKKQSDGKPVSIFNNDYFDSLIYVAYAYSQMERNEEARYIIDKVRTLAKEEADKGFRIWPTKRYYLGLLEFIDGNSDLALVTIQRAVNQGWVNPWQLDNEPMLHDLRTNPEFIDIRQSLLTRVRILREQLAYEEKFTAI